MRWLGLLLFVCVPAGAAELPADLILRSGRVWTLDGDRPEAQAVAVRGDRIAVVGSDADVLALRGPKTEVTGMSFSLRGRRSRCP